MLRHVDGRELVRKNWSRFETLEAVGHKRINISFISIYGFVPARYIPRTCSVLDLRKQQIWRIEQVSKFESVGYASVCCFSALDHGREHAN